MAVRYYNEDCSYRLLAKRRVSAWIRASIEHEGYRLGDINYIFCSSEHHIGINRQYLGHDYYTDVITFDYSDRKGSGIVSGDIFIDCQTVALNAAEYGATARQEMLRVLIHGVLHLCGYKDKTPSAEKRMHARENFYLKRFSEDPA